MNEDDLIAIPPFDALPMGESDAADYLSRPDLRECERVVYEAATTAEVRDFLNDPALVPKGSVRNPFGGVRAVFWQLRKSHP